MEADWTLQRLLQVGVLLFQLFERWWVLKIKVKSGVRQTDEQSRKGMKEGNERKRGEGSVPFGVFGPCCVRDRREDEDENESRKDVVVSFFTFLFSFLLLSVSFCPLCRWFGSTAQERREEEEKKRKKEEDHVSGAAGRVCGPRSGEVA